MDDGNYARSICSQSFVSCSNGQAFYRMCAIGTWYDAASGTCQRPRQVAGCRGLLFTAGGAENVRG